MGSVNDRQSARNSLTSTRFAENHRSGREDLSTAGAAVDVFDDLWGSPKALAYGDGTEEEPIPYSRKVYQAIIEIDGRDKG